MDELKFYFDRKESKIVTKYGCEEPPVDYSDSSFDLEESSDLSQSQNDLSDSSKDMFLTIN